MKRARSNLSISVEHILRWFPCVKRSLRAPSEDEIDQMLAPLPKETAGND